MWQSQARTGSAHVAGFRPSREPACLLFLLFRFSLCLLLPIAASSISNNHKCFRTFFILHQSIIFKNVLSHWQTRKETKGATDSTPVVTPYFSHSLPNSTIMDFSRLCTARSVAQVWMHLRRVVIGALRPNMYSSIETNFGHRPLLY